jgi:general secretion pathway protein G
MFRTVRRTTRPGFTLIEILIVVIILGILAAIVIPQFSSASNDARKSNVQTTVQTLRSQIALYKLQHQDTLPDLVTSWDPIVKKTDAAGSTTPAAGVQTFGPYMQETPVNSLNSKSTVSNGDGLTPASTAVGFVFDYAAGAGSGKIWGTDVDGKTLIP